MVPGTGVQVLRWDQYGHWFTFKKNLKFYSQISLRKNKCIVMIYGPWVRAQRLWLRQYGHIVNMYWLINLFRNISRGRSIHTLLLYVHYILIINCNSLTRLLDRRWLRLSIGGWGRVNDKYDHILNMYILLSVLVFHPFIIVNSSWKQHDTY